jgi:hypothetical protein
MLVFTGKNLFRNLESGKNNQFPKDTVYRFLNSQNFNWRKFLLLLYSTITKNVIVPLTSDDRVNVLELFAKIREHMPINLLKASAFLPLLGQMVIL